MTTKRVRQVTEYFDKCDVCGEESRVSEGERIGTCYECQTKEAKRKVLRELNFMIGAKVVRIVPFGYGVHQDGDLEALIIEDANGKRYEITASGWDERYIEWEEVES